MLSLDGPAASRASAAYVAAAIHAIAREEEKGRWPKRLREPGRATWETFRGRLDERAFVQLLLEDAAITHPWPFKAELLLGDPEPTRAIPSELATRWVDEIASSSELSSATTDYVVAQARRLGLPSRLARSDLHQMQPHQRALELPGTGGQLAHHILTTQERLSLGQNFVIACGCVEELVLAGLVATEIGASGELPIRLDPSLTKTLAERTVFDFVLGLAPDKGGAFAEARLLELFPNARVLLV